MKPIKKKFLNIGAGKTYIPDYINIDIAKVADISIDIGKEKLPFEDNSVDLIFSHHILEHIPDYLFALSEIHRVLKHNGVFLLGVPYLTLTKFNLVNPYHLHNFNEYSFHFFDPKKLKGSAVEDNSIMFTKAFHRFHYLKNFKYLPRFLRRWCRGHLFNVVKRIDFGLIAIKNNNSIPDNIDHDELIKQFDQCLSSRKRYKS